MKSICLSLVALGTAAMCLVSCSSDEVEVPYPFAQAVVTVKPLDDGAFYLQLDDSTSLLPSNMKVSPFGKKQVRAWVEYSPKEYTPGASMKPIGVNRIDSIYTKQLLTVPATLTEEYKGGDPVEVVKSFMTVCEDGYLTLRLRTRFGNAQVKHTVNLYNHSNTDNPFNLYLVHEANGDTDGPFSDIVIAFNLRKLPVMQGETKEITLHWLSFSGWKEAKFKLKSWKDIHLD